MGFFAVYQERQELPAWKSEWRKTFERRSYEDSLKARRTVSAQQIQKRQIKAAATVSNKPKPQRAPATPMKECDGCGKKMRSSTVTSTCQKCVCARPHCACGRTIYRDIEGNMCRECYLKTQRKKCVLCDKILNESNEYGLCKIDYAKYRMLIHQEIIRICEQPGCDQLIRPNNQVGLCRSHARETYNRRDRDKKKREMLQSKTQCIQKPRILATNLLRMAS